MEDDFYPFSKGGGLYFQVNQPFVFSGGFGSIGFTEKRNCPSKSVFHEFSWMT